MGSTPPRRTACVLFALAMGVVPALARCAAPRASGEEARDAGADGLAADDGGRDLDAAPSPDAESPVEVDVFLVGGQSNAVGIATRGDSPTVGDGTAFQYYAGKLTPANDPVGNAHDVSAWPQFAVTYVGLTGHRIVFVPSAVAGSALLASNDDGHGNWSAAGAAFLAAVTSTQAALAALRAIRWVPHFKGVLWVQGETDAAAIAAAQSTETGYRVALRDLVSRFETSLGSEMAFYLFQTGTNANTSDLGFAQVRRAQDAVATSLDQIFVVARDAVGFKDRPGMLAADGVHYTQAGLNELGRYGAESVASIVRGGPNRADLDPPGNAKPSVDSLAMYQCAGAARRDVAFQIIANSAPACAASGFAVSYGDQNADDLPVSAASCAALGFTPSHSYAADGDYTVELFRGTVAQVQAGDSTRVARSTIHHGPVPAGFAVDVFVVAGQSNAVGNSRAPWRAPRTLPGQAFQYAVGGTAATATAGGCILAADEVVGFDSVGSAWPQFANTYVAHSARRIVFVPTAQNGTALLQKHSSNSGTGPDNWSPTGDLFARSVARTQSALADLRAAGFEPALKGILWVQGEADAPDVQVQQKDTYAAALRDLVARYRASLGADLPFYIFQSGGQTDADPPTAASLAVGYAAIRDAQDSVESPADHVHVVTRVAKTFVARGMLTDSVHYTQAGYNELGRTGAEGVVKAAGIDIAAPTEKTIVGAAGVARAGMPVALSGHMNESSSCEARQYSLRFGDGVSVDLAVPGGACAPRPYSVTHVFAAPGNYTVELFDGAVDDVQAGLAGSVGHVSISVTP